MMMVLMLALAGQVSWTEDFTPGSRVDLAQGFYVCPNIQPMDKLTRETNDLARRGLAGRLGCQWIQDRRPRVHKVLEILAGSCQAPMSQDGVLICRREGRAIRVQGVKGVVVWINMDREW
jgi:hypothetical protein